MISASPASHLIRTAGAFALALTLLSGCKSTQEKAIEHAKELANSTGQPQQVITTDKNGNTITTLIQPLQPGQSTQAVTTTVTPGQVPPGTANGAAIPNEAQTAAQNLAQQQGQPQVAGQPQGTGQPAAANQPIIRPADVNVAAGTGLTIRINQHISVKTTQVGDRFTGEFEEPVVGRNGNVVIPRGTPVDGVVDAAHHRGRFKGASILELRLTSLTLNGQRYPLDTSDLTRTKKGKGRRSAALIGGGTGLGMLAGGLAGGGVGLLVGGLVGGGAGTAVSGLTGNGDIEIPAESVVRFRLSQDLVLQEP